MNILSKKKGEEEVELKGDEHYHKATLKEIKLMRKALLNQASLKTKFLQGMAGGLGTVVGATLLVALLIFILNQFANIEILEPLVHRIIEIVDRAK